MRHSTTTQTSLDGYAETTIHYAAERLIGHFGFTNSDREDIAQELALDLIERLPSYDPAKAKRTTFIKDCVEHRISTLIRDRGRRCRDPRRVQRLSSASDQPDPRSVSAESLVDHAHRDEIAHADLRMDVAAVIARLPAHQQNICTLLAEHSPYAISKLLGRSKRAVYRDVHDIRAAFSAAGLGPDLDANGKADNEAA
jgi:RNA polymerase sigma-70 factor, ECF subfamily